MNKLLFMTLMILALFGIVFLSLLVHEGIHIAQIKKPYSICYDFQQESMMHVKVNVSAYNNSEKFNNFDAYTEKWAGIGTFIALMVGGLGIGIILMCWFYENYHPLLKIRR